MVSMTTRAHELGAGLRNLFGGLQAGWYFLEVPFVSCPKSFTITNGIPLTAGEAEITENKIKDL